MTDPMSTDMLRVAAQNWSLEGDRNLLNLLQNIHQDITSRCLETSKRVNEMLTTLDHAKVSMDNVNNRFMSLSNTQFVESRVDEDDPEFMTPTLAVKQPKAEESYIKSDATKKWTTALLSIERNHERVIIMDDSDSESDDGASVILRPKDVYQRRPLPFIIGSQSWKNKWHAGLIAEESDTESMVSKKDEVSSESDESVAMSAPNIHADASSFRSVSPASLPAQDDLYKPDMTRIYKPCAASNTAPRGYLFVDEPPPIDNDTDATSIRTESDTDDIFSELHKDVIKKKIANTSYNDFDNNNIDVTKMGDDKKLFNVEEKNLFDTNQNDNDIHVRNNDNFDRNDNRKDDRFINITDKDVPTHLVEDKRPTGAVSLFGTKNAADNIGAAILKRNQKTSSSEDDDERTNNLAQTTRPNANKHTNNNKHNKIPENNNKSDHINRDINNLGQNVIEQIVKKQNKGDNQVVVTEKNIFDELFAKTKQTSKPIEETKNVYKKVDVFNDIFDDIDNMFTSDVKINKNYKNSTKISIFDDLASDVTVKTDIKDKKHLSKSIFEDDDDLFNNKPVNKTEIISEEKSQKNITNDKIATEDKMFTSFAKDVTDTKDIITDKTNIFDSKDMFNNYGNKSETIKQTLNNPHEDNNKRLKSIFDSDSDDGDIFSVIKAPDSKKAEITNNNSDIIFGDIVNTKNNSNISVDNLSTDKKVKNPDFAIKTNESINYNENIKSQQTHLKEQDNSNLESLFEKPSIREVLHKLDSESNKSITNTVKSIPEINKAEGSQDSNNKLDENFMNNENIQTDPVISNDKIEVYYESTVSNSVYDIETPNTVKSHENYSETKTKNFLNTDTKHINDLTHTQNQENASDIPKSITRQSNPVKTSEQLVSNDAIKVDNVANQQKDLFEDIFPIEPPDLEKPKDTKSNQNVNALFGDDSEDENLFFKKETLISDEIPDTSQVKPIDPLFGVFTDEPPDFDDDFLFNTPTHSGDANKKAVNSNNKLNSFNSSPKNDESTDKCIAKTIVNDKESITTNLDRTKEENKDREETDSNTIEQSKSIGKLKPINFNINVTNLLPGASPKRIVKPSEHSTDVSSTDGAMATKLTANETVSTNISKDKTVNYQQKDPDSLVNTVSFDSDQESTVLDNKISKQRAKIPVKRRPSTRQARRDAARKSVIDLNENIDTVDSNLEQDQSIPTQKDSFNTNSKIHRDHIISKQSDTFLSRENLDYSDISNITDNNLNTINNAKMDITKEVNLKHETALDNSTTAISKEEKIKQGLGNDTEQTYSQIDGTQVLNIIENDIYVYREPKIQDNELEVNKITTLGRVYHENTEKDVLETIKHENVEKISVFDDGDDDDLFVGNTNKETLTKTSKSNVTTSAFDNSSLFLRNNSKSQRNTETLFDKSENLFCEKEFLPKTTKSVSIFDDDNADLFSSGNTKPKELIKKTLFDDTSDDDDDGNLFGGKSAKVGDTIKKSGLFTSKPNKMETKLLKSTLFDDDDDNDLFGSTSKSKKETESQSQKIVTKEKTVTMADTDFEDPLSILNHE